MRWHHHVFDGYVVAVTCPAKVEYFHLASSILQATSEAKSHPKGAPSASTKPMPKKILDPTTAASNQGTLRVTREEYIRYGASTALGRAFLRMNSYLPVTRWFRPHVGSYRWQHFSEWFMYGDTNPTVVLDARAGLVAAFTDLDSQLRQRFPVIKIFVEKLSRLFTPAKDGDTFAAVSVYGWGKETRSTGRWGVFFPIVVDCVIQDEVKREFIKAKIPDSHWRALEIGVAQLPNTHQPGIYDIVLPDALKAML